MRTRSRASESSHELLHLLRPHGGRLLDEHVLAGLECGLRELVVGDHGRRDHDRLELGVVEQLGEVGRDAGVRVARSELLALRLVGVAEPGEVGELVEVAREVLPPRAEAGLSDSRHSFQTLPSTRPLEPVALRKSTTSLASSTSRS